MLRIREYIFFPSKDGKKINRRKVNLKELEEFGFEYINESEQFLVLNKNQDSILIHDREITLRVNEANVYEDYDLSVLYDLFQTGLVEKVEEGE